ncbi:MAG: hypothetical protein IT310_10745, partial [Anaerolineales bacterium]|nr:hypothetical protein [Anaerolineales bacterium]
GEQAIIATQMAYYGLINDQENLELATIEWQMELTDGGAPGNTMINEMGEQIGKLANNPIPRGAFNDIPEITLQPYLPDGDIVGQLFDYSCVAASCATILNDPSLQEGIIEIVGTDSASGVGIQNAVTALNQYTNKKYIYVDTINLTDLKKYLENGPAIISINTSGLNHAVVVDNITSDGYFLIRDPLPVGSGSSYKIQGADIWNYWRRERGAVISP